MSEKTLPEIPSAGLPRWPRADEFGYAFDELSAKDAALRFQRARADAALARLRVAVEALNAVVKEASPENNALWFEGVYDKIAAKALSAIGPLPPETP